jgi:mannose-6-phosphate isomerase-like protein (cupin superfamily)
LLRIVRDLAADRDRWLARVVHRPDQRWFERVTLADDHDVWLIGWDSFQGVDLHDHGDATGVLYVVDGELVETSTTRGTARVVEQTLHAGTARAFGAGHVHRVVNPAARPATSLHVYSPPLSVMDFYRPGEGRTLERTHTESAFAPRSGAGELR